jgi:hypothetical protein
MERREQSLKAGHFQRCCAWLVLFVAVACGAPPAGPGPNPGPDPPPPPPPSNALPVIESVRVQGSRSRQPANFADVGETIAITAQVRDAETAVDQLTYTWTAPAGTFAGTGASVTWTAPQVVDSAAAVTITLKVTEKFGFPGVPPAFEQSQTAEASVSLHDSVKEVGGMARQFLLEFSDSNLRDVGFVMRNFARNRCPQPSEVDSETDDVTRNRRERRITDYSVGAPATAVNFGGFCPFRNKRGDACAVVPVFWADIDLATNKAGSTRGNGVIAAAYSADDKRWWLCASDYEALVSTGSVFRFSR